MKYITKMGGGNSLLTFLVLLTVLVFPRSASSQDTYYVDTVSGGTDAPTCTVLSTPCTLTTALGAVDGGDTIAIRVRRDGGSVTITGDHTIDEAVTFATYQRGGGLVSGMLEFTGTVTLSAAGQFTPYKMGDVAVDVQFKEVTLSIDATNTQPFGMDTEERWAISGALTTGNATIDSLVVDEHLTIKGTDTDPSAAGHQAPTLVIKNLEVKSEVTLTIGTKEEDMDSTVELRVPLQKSGTDVLVVDGMIAGTGALWIAHLNTGTERGATAPRLFDLHHTTEYMPHATDLKMDMGCAQVRGGGEIQNDIYAIASGNVCISLKKVGGLFAAGSIQNDEADTNNDMDPDLDNDSLTTDLIFRRDVEVTGDVQQWNDARIIFERKSTIRGNVVLDAGALPAIINTTNFGTPNIPANIIRSQFVRTGGRECDQGTDPDRWADLRTPSRGMKVSGVQFAGNAMIEKDLEHRFGYDLSGGGGRDNVCETRVLFLADSTGTGDKIYTSHIRGDLYAEGGMQVILDGHAPDGPDEGEDPDYYLLHNLNLDGDIHGYLGDGRDRNTITMGAAASTQIDGMCTSKELGLGKGNRLTLTGAGPHVIVTEDNLGIPSLIVLEETSVQSLMHPFAPGRRGGVRVKNLHIEDGGKLITDETVTIIDRLGASGSVILGGKGIQGTFHPDTWMTKIVYASSATDQVPLVDFDFPNHIRGKGEVVSFHLPAGSAMRVEEPMKVETLGLCSGSVILVDDEDPKTKTITVTETLHIKDGMLELDRNEPGDFAGDMGEKASAADGYTLTYRTGGEREAGSELMAARDVEINDPKAMITVKEALSIPGKLEITKGMLRVMGDLTVGTSSVVGSADRLLKIEEGELHSNGNSVMVHGRLEVGTEMKAGRLMTGDGDLHLLGQRDKDGIYMSESAMVTVNAKGAIDVGMGTFQLGPETSKIKQNGLRFPQKPRVRLDINGSRMENGSVRGTILVPAGSRETLIFGADTLDTIILDGTRTPKESGEIENAAGEFHIHAGPRQTLMIDSLSVMKGHIYLRDNQEDWGAYITVNRDVVLDSGYLTLYADTLTVKGNLTTGRTGGLWSRSIFNHHIEIRGDLTINEGASQGQYPTSDDLSHNTERSGLFMRRGHSLTVTGNLFVSEKADVFWMGPFDNTSATNIGRVPISSKLILGGDLEFNAPYSYPARVFPNSVEFAGNTRQSVKAGPKVSFGDIIVDNPEGIEIGSNVMQRWWAVRNNSYMSSTLTLKRGVVTIADPMHTWLVGSLEIEADLRESNVALGSESTIKRGSRSSYVSGRLSRLVQRGNSGGGMPSGGYLFPVGGIDGDRAHYRPLILQLPDDLTEADTAAVSPAVVPEGAMPAWPAENILVPVPDGFLTLDVYADIFWKVELNEAMDQNPHIRVAAGGLENVFDVDGLRMVQWDCDWSNPRLAGTAIIGEDEESFAENGYVNGVLNLTQMSVEVGTCAILGVAANGLENPIHLDALTGGLSRVQFIHNVPLPAPVDLSLDGVRLQSGLEFQSATGYAVVAAGAHSASIQVAGAPADQAITFDLPTLAHERSYAVIAHGAATAPMVEILETRMTSLADNMVDAILVHGSADLGEVDVRTVDMTSDHAATMVLANNIKFGEATNYLALEPGLHNIQVKSAQGEEEIDVFEVSLNGYEGETVILNLSGTKNVMAIGFEIFGVDIRGDRISTQTVTSVVDEIAELPTEFALHGNYPNPFNPSTRIQFDLPESAQVTLQVVDMLGREVMTLPAKEFEAGANRNMEINAVNLASGTYLYRMIATGAESRYVKTGRMTLVK